MGYRNKSVIGTPVEHRRAGSVSRSGGTALRHTAKAPSKATEEAEAARAIGSKLTAHGVLLKGDKR